MSTVRIDHDGPVNDAEFDQAGTRIVTASADGTARLWTREGAPLHAFPHGAPVRSARFSTDGTRSPPEIARETRANGSWRRQRGDAGPDAP